jgi:pullulanase
MAGMKRWLPVFFLFQALPALLSCTSGERGGAALTVHYYRYTADYGGWNVWVWPADPPGEGKSFAFGAPGAEGYVSAYINLPQPVKEFGMIIRKSDQHGDWAERDGEADRFSKEKEVWLLQNDPAVYTEKPETGKPPIVFATADKEDELTLALSTEPEDYGVFSVYETKSGLRLSGKSGKGKNSREAVIMLDERLPDVAALYTVRDESGHFAERPLVMRGILDGFYYGGDDLGPGYSPAETVFKVWAPTAISVSLALYGDSGEYDGKGRVRDQDTGEFQPMEKDEKTGLWSGAVQGNLAGKYYLYRVEFADGTVNYAADPYAQAVSANGQRMAIIDMKKTGPPGWKPDRKPPFAAPQDAVIYELHVRDFSLDENSGMKHKGKFLAFTERGTKNRSDDPTGIDHLINLGITHVHLLPAFDFASINELTVDDPASVEPKFNWGYDPQNYNVPEGSYSTNPGDPATRINEFKRMVQALHDGGIRVVMDVVYNHTYRTGAGPFDHLVPGYYYRTSDTGAYSNGSGCGNEVASERPMVRKFIIDSCLYWAREYGVDGFRFDLMGLIDTPTIERLTETLRREAGEDILVYGEPWTAGESALPPELRTLKGSQKGKNFAVFNDNIRTAIKGGSDDDSRGFATGLASKEPEGAGEDLPYPESGIVAGILGSLGDFTFRASESINYVTAHDNLNLWDKISFSLGVKNLAASPYGAIKYSGDLMENNAVRAALLANGIIFTSQGIPFFQAGDEMLRTKFGDHNSYTSPDSVNTVRWENASLYRDVIAYYSGLIRLRREHPAFRMDRGEDIGAAVEILAAGGQLVAFLLKGNANGDSWRTILTAYNGALALRTLELPQDVPVWRQVVDAGAAGTETLAEIRDGCLTLPPLSMAVLHE